MVTLKNITDKDVKVIFNGVDYTIKAEDTLEVSEELAIFWLKVHEFLFVEKAVEAKEAETKVVKEIKEEIKKVVKKEEVKKEAKSDK